MVQRVTLLKKLKERRVTSQLAKDVGLDRRSISSVDKGPVMWLKKSENRKERVLAFLQLPDHSVTLAGKKDTMTVNCKKKQKVVLTQFLNPLNEEYNKQNSEKLVSLSFFRNIRRKAKEAAQLPEIKTFQMRKRVQVTYGDPEEPKGAMKLRPGSQSMPRAERIKVLLAEFLGLVKHVFRATSQHQSIRSLRQQLTAEECTIHIDFAQNWNVGYSEEF